MQSAMVNFQCFRRLGRQSRAMLCAATMLIALATLPACSGSARAGAFANQNDELRRDQLELREQVDKLEKDLALRVAEIDKLKQELGKQGTIEGADVPHVVTLKFGRYTGGIDTTGDNIDDAIRIYLQTLDQHGRVIPVAGRAAVQVVSIPEVGEPRVVASRTFAPSELDAAYRQGLVGTHYTLDVPLPDGTSDDMLTVKVTLTDSASGATLNFQQAVPVRR